MRMLLAGLMCGMLTSVQAFAISGGPFGGPAHVTVTGTYAGVFVPIRVVPDPSQPDVTLPPDNSLALFTLRVPQTGGAVGAAVVFRNGLFYPGVIDAVADPNSARVSGVVNASFQKMFTTRDPGPPVSTITFTFNYNANGGFDKVKVVANGTSSGATAAKLRGKASLTYTTENDPHNPDFARADSGGPIQYRVHGFKQSESTG